MLTVLTLIAATAQAQEYIEIDTYYFDDEATIAGRDGWEGGYSDDEWYGYVDGDINFALSLTDDNGGSFGSRDAADNWLVYTDIQRTDATMTTYMYTEDDDTMGLVFGFQDRNNYYLFLMSNDSSPINLGNSNAVLLKIEDGDAEVLDSSRSGYDAGGFDAMWVGINDGLVFGGYWDGDFSGSADIFLSYTDSDPFEGGSFGFYAYDSGYDGGWSNSTAGFAAPTFYDIDEDDDGVPDDEDNCEFDANANQADADGDGIGDECDDSSGGGGDNGGGDNGGGDNGGGDNGGGDNGGGDNGGGNNGGGNNGGGDSGSLDTGVDLSQIDDGDVKIGGAGCSTLGGMGGLTGLMLTIFAVYRRRK